jgi:gluconolactonase
MIELETVATGLQFPEGPIALADGSVLVVEIKRGTLTRISPEGELTVVAQCGGGPNGAAIGPDGAVYICNNGGFEWSVVDGFLLAHGTPADYSGGRIQRVDLETGDVEELYTECEGRALRGPNDLVFDADGGFYFTDHGKGNSRDMDLGFVYYARPDGSSITCVASGMHGPNGVGLSPDGTKLYVSETTTGFVWWWDVKGPGALSGGQTFAGSGGGNFFFSWPDYAIFDSLGVDAAGNVCVATLLKSGITVVSPGGELVDFIANVDDPGTTNICWGGEDMSTAYITSSCTGRLLKATWPTPGLRLNFNA